MCFPSSLAEIPALLAFMQLCFLKEKCEKEKKRFAHSIKRAVLAVLIQDAQLYLLQICFTINALE